jgi:preprotein translocase subunit Sec63
VGRGIPRTSVLYLDGPCPDGKNNTQEQRAKLRLSVALRAKAGLDNLEQCVKEERRVRKRHFINISRDIKAVLYWSLASRASFAQFMRKNWKIQECDFEADVAIARDCMPVSPISAIHLSRMFSLPVYK